jgi:hypothetical protein
VNKSLIFLLALCWSLRIGHAQEAISTIRILPEDIVQGSVQQIHFTTNKFAVRWTYTEAGARKMLAFWEQHTGQKVRTQVGSFETPPSVVAPHDPATYPTWREGWLKHRTDKFFGVSEDDAKMIVAGLESK